MNVSEAFFHSLSERGACAPEEEACLRLLDSLGIPYRGLTHDPGDTIELCKEIETKLGAPIVKNLFLCDRQKTSFYLLIMPGGKPFKTKYLSKQIGSARLSFADAESMEALLGVKPGSASVLALMNDTGRRVRLLLDSDLLAHETVGFHPCRNTSTLWLKLADILGIFLPALGAHPETVTLPAEPPAEN